MVDEGAEAEVSLEMRSVGELSAKAEGKGGEKRDRSKEVCASARERGRSCKRWLDNRETDEREREANKGFVDEKQNLCLSGLLRKSAVTFSTPGL
jgi:hypothetical protein